MVHTLLQLNNFWAIFIFIILLKWVFLRLLPHILLFCFQTHCLEIILRYLFLTKIIWILIWICFGVIIRIFLTLIIFLLRAWLLIRFGFFYLNNFWFFNSFLFLNNFIFFGLLFSLFLFFLFFLFLPFFFPFFLSLLLFGNFLSFGFLSLPERLLDLLIYAIKWYIQ